MNISYLGDQFYNHSNAFKTYKQENHPIISNSKSNDEKFSNGLDFKVIKDLDGNTFDTNKNLGICRINWNGVVDIEKAQQLVGLGGDYVEYNKYSKVILNQSGLLEFDSEATIWIKSFIKSRAKKLSDSVDKLALINAKSIKGIIFSNLIEGVIRLVMPKLKIKKFNNVEDAISWLI
ncbi:hypothetical protein [Ekhidna lutea]|nr:hypothetical protein [Ekhidna lutea]